jgi:hypothetical protein
MKAPSMHEVRTFAEPREMEVDSAVTGACNAPESAIAYEVSIVVIETFHQG